MDLNEYQNKATRTANTDLPREMQIATFALGLAGESGEVADLLKKHLGHGHPLDREKLVKELGDVLWYVAALADVYGIELGAVAETNLAKLRARYPDGFSSERSRNRPAFDANGSPVRGGPDGGLVCRGDSDRYPDGFS